MDRPPCPGGDAPMIPAMIAARPAYVAHFVCVRFDRTSLISPCESKSRPQWPLPEEPLQ